MCCIRFLCAAFWITSKALERSRAVQRAAPYHRQNGCGIGRSYGPPRRRLSRKNGS